MFYMITKEDCTYCDAAKKYLSEKGLEFTTTDYKSSPFILALMKKSWLKTVPQIWTDESGKMEYIGGFSDLLLHFDPSEDLND